jgi:hypothetical protein
MAPPFVAPDGALVSCHDLCGARQARSIAAPTWVGMWPSRCCTSCTPRRPEPTSDSEIWRASARCCLPPTDLFHVTTRVLLCMSHPAAERAHGDGVPAWLSSSVACACRLGVTHPFLILLVCLLTCLVEFIPAGDRHTVGPGAPQHRASPGRLRARWVSRRVTLGRQSRRPWMDPSLHIPPGLATHSR